jgi:peptidyl-tRNA hydrolase, PTH1 family
MVAEELARRWELPPAKDRFRARVASGRLPGAPSFATGAASEGPPVKGRAPRELPRVAILCPQTYMNDAGRSVGPARGAYKLALERILVVHDEIDLPFGEVRVRVGGGLAGHNGLKSLKRELGSAEFTRARVGVGRPSCTDPEIVSAYVLGRFTEPIEEVHELIERTCREVELIVLGEVE